MHNEDLEPFRIRVTRVGRGYLAENEPLELSVGAGSAVEAAEKAREAATGIINGVMRAQLPGTLFVRIDDEMTVAFVMRPFGQRFELGRDCADTFYVDSQGRMQP